MVGYVLGGFHITVTSTKDLLYWQKYRYTLLAFYSWNMVILHKASK